VGMLLAFGGEDARTRLNAEPLEAGAGETTPR